MRIEAPFDPDWVTMNGTFRFLMMRGRREPCVYISPHSRAIPSHWELRRRLIETLNISRTPTHCFGGGYFDKVHDRIEQLKWEATSLPMGIPHYGPEDTALGLQLIHDLGTALRQSIAATINSHASEIPAQQAFQRSKTGKRTKRQPKK